MRKRIQQQTQKQMCFSRVLVLTTQKNADRVNSANQFSREPRAHRLAKFCLLFVL